MQKNSTDYIAKLAFDTVKTHWKIFILLPLTPFVFLIVIGGLAALGNTMYGWGSSPSTTIALFELLYLGLVLFFLVYNTATVKWCEEHFKGAVTLDLKAGFRYGLSRLGGVIGTSLLTAIKVSLWTLLLLVPGIYKVLVYSQSIHISQLEKISGGDANRLSKTLIKEAGILRTIGNYSALIVLFYIGIFGLYILAVIGFVVFAPSLIAGFSESTGLANGPINPVAYLMGGAALILFVVGYMAIISFMQCFGHYQYLVYRDENKGVFQKAIKDLNSINS